jgi:glycosyltransferase involved in cell wall biosynthesis
MGKNEMLLSVVVPVFNEEPTVGHVIQQLKEVMEKTEFKYEIIVVDDCSQDGSLEIAKNLGVRPFSLKEHMGKGYALRAGFAKARGEIITTIDSDGSHSPRELPSLLNAIIQNKADIVIGSRYSNQKSVDAKRLNIAGVRLFNFLIKILTKTGVSDSQSGYRVIKSKLLTNMKLKSGGYEIESEMLVKAAKRGFRIMEVPISFEQRTYGTSRLDPLVDGFRILMSIFSAYIKSGIA